jgi:hypothetical protein
MSDDPYIFPRQGLKNGSIGFPHRRGAWMANYRLQGQELVTANGWEKVGSLNGTEVFDRHNERVGSIRDNQIYDTHNEKAAEIQGEDIYDAHYERIGTLSQARNAIDGATGGIGVAALWYFFVR